MKTTLTILILAAAAMAQDGQSCTPLSMLDQTVCRTTLDGKTTYTMSETKADLSSLHVISEAEYDAAIKADTDATAKLAEQVRADIVRNEAIAKYGKRYYEKALSCVQSGGQWSLTFHSCKAGK